MAISTAVSDARRSRVVGYKLKSTSFEQSTPNLPQRIAVLGEANIANQAGLDTTPFEFVTAKGVGDKYGYGSPLHQIARILRPQSGDLLGGVPTVIYPQTSDGGSSQTVIKKGVAVATSVTANATHKLVINGRDNVDGEVYSYAVAIGDTVADVRQKMIDAVSGVLGAPVIATENVADVDFTTKWRGITSAELNIEIDTDGNDAGIVYSEISKTAGAGITDIATSLALFGETWNTLVINPYGVDDTTLAAYETVNGVPDPDNPTGRYNGIVFKPFVAFAGYVGSDKDTLSAITDAAARQSQVTNVIAPAPNSLGWTYEAAANMVVSYASIAQNNPAQGNGGKSYNDMPVPADGDIGDFADYEVRDFLVKKGCSTVTLESGAYTVQDMLTTYHPSGETPPKFAKVRDLTVDWNVGFRWKIIEVRDIQDKIIVGDEPVLADNTISINQGKQLVRSFVDDIVADALIVDAAFSKESVGVEVNANNPNRLDFFFRYKRSGTADIVSTDAEVDFAFSV